MQEQTNPKVVVIEDERSHAIIIRQHLKKVLQGNQLSKNVDILPLDRPSFYSMEEFVRSDAGKDRKMRAFLIVDLFLAQARENPSIVFHQLMYNLFLSPTDHTLVCGRLGVLSKLKASYENAFIELFSYFPVYFATQNEPVPNDGFAYEDCSVSKIKQLVAENYDEIAQHLNKARTDYWDLATATQVIQTIAMRDALYERIKGIFGCRDVFDHMTEESTLSNPRDRDILLGTAKTNMMHEDAERLAKKMLSVVQKMMAGGSVNQDVRR